jgi:hypothetical protein
VLDGILLDLDVSADFLRGAVTVCGVIMRCGFAEGNMIVGREVDEGGMILRGAVTVADVIVGSAIVSGGMIVAVDYDLAQELAILIGA